MNLRFYSNDNYSSEIRRNILQLYLNRRREKADGKGSKVHRFLIAHSDYDSDALGNLENTLVASLSIDGKLAAFWAGYIDESHSSVVVPRLAIDQRYARYSPGVLLINETMKSVRPQYGLKLFDLSRGGEAYKYTMGGAAYYNYTYRLQ